MSKPRPSFLSDFRRFFLRGLAVLLPSILTLWVLWYALVFLYRNVAEPLNAGLRTAVLAITPRVVPEPNLPDWFRVTEDELAQYRASLPAVTQASATEADLVAGARHQKLRALWDSRWYLGGSGLVAAIVVVYLAGVLLGGLIGRRLYARVEALIARIPGFKQIYPHMKQLVDLVMGDKPMAFKRVVLVQYPRQGVWTLGFVTGSSIRRVSELTGSRPLSVFIPSTPTPFTGFVINVSEEDVIDAAITIDEAFRFVLTGGVLVPDRPLDLVAGGDPAAAGTRSAN